MVLLQNVLLFALDVVSGPYVYCCAPYNPLMSHRGAPAVVASDDLEQPLGTDPLTVPHDSHACSSSDAADDVVLPPTTETRTLRNSSVLSSLSDEDEPLSRLATATTATVTTEQSRAPSRSESLSAPLAISPHTGSVSPSLPPMPMGTAAGDSAPLSTSAISSSLLKASKPPTHPATPRIRPPPLSREDSRTRVTPLIGSEVAAGVNAGNSSSSGYLDGGGGAGTNSLFNGNASSARKDLGHRRASEAAAAVADSPDTFAGFTDVFVPRSEFCRRVLWLHPAESGTLFLYYPEEIPGEHYQRKTLRYSICFVFKVSESLMTVGEELMWRLVRPYSVVLMNVAEELRDAEKKHGYVSRGLTGACAFAPATLPASVPVPVAASARSRRGPRRGRHRTRTSSKGNGGTESDNASFIHSPHSALSLPTTTAIIAVPSAGDTPGQHSSLVSNRSRSASGVILTDPTTATGSLSDHHNHHHHHPTSVTEGGGRTATPSPLQPLQETADTAAEVASPHSLIASNATASQHSFAASSGVGKEPSRCVYPSLQARTAINCFVTPSIEHAWAPLEQFVAALYDSLTVSDTASVRADTPTTGTAEAIKSVRGIDSSSKSNKASTVGQAHKGSGEPRGSLSNHSASNSKGRVSPYSPLSYSTHRGGGRWDTTRWRGLTGTPGGGAETATGEQIPKEMHKWRHRTASQKARRLRRMATALLDGDDGDQGVRDAAIVHLSDRITIHARRMPVLECVRPVGLAVTPVPITHYDAETLWYVDIAVNQVFRLVDGQRTVADIVFALAADTSTTLQEVYAMALSRIPEGHPHPQDVTARDAYTVLVPLNPRGLPSGYSSSPSNARTIAVEIAPVAAPAVVSPVGATNSSQSTLQFFQSTHNGHSVQSAGSNTRGGGGILRPSGPSSVHSGGSNPASGGVPASGAALLPTHPGVSYSIHVVVPGTWGLTSEMVAEALLHLEVCHAVKLLRPWGGAAVYHLTSAFNEVLGDHQHPARRAIGEYMLNVSQQERQAARRWRRQQRINRYTGGGGGALGKRIVEDVSNECSSTYISEESLFTRPPTLEKGTSHMVPSHTNAPTTITASTSGAVAVGNVTAIDARSLASVDTPADFSEEHHRFRRTDNPFSSTTAHAAGSTMGSTLHRKPQRCLRNAHGASSWSGGGSSLSLHHSLGVSADGKLHLTLSNHPSSAVRSGRGTGSSAPSHTRLPVVLPSDAEDCVSSRSISSSSSSRSGTSSGSSDTEDDIPRAYRGPALCTTAFAAGSGRSEQGVRPQPFTGSQHLAAGPQRGGLPTVLLAQNPALTTAVTCKGEAALPEGHGDAESATSTSGGTCVKAPLLMQKKSREQTIEEAAEQTRRIELEIRMAASAAICALSKLTNSTVAAMQRDMRLMPGWSEFFQRWSSRCCLALTQLALLNEWLAEVSNPITDHGM